MANSFLPSEQLVLQHGSVFVHTPPVPQSASTEQGPPSFVPPTQVCAQLESLASRQRQPSSGHVQSMSEVGVGSRNVWESLNPACPARNVTRSPAGTPESRY